MKTTTLFFPSFDKLWEFKQLTDTRNFKIHSVHLSLIAERKEEDIKIKEEDIKIAITGFGAQEMGQAV